MADAPLIGPYHPDDVLARTEDGPHTVRRFLSDVSRLASSLPDRRSVLNLLAGRYDFLVGFAAAIVRRQVTLLPQSRAPQMLRRIASEYSDSYCLTDPGDEIDGVESVEFRHQAAQAGCPLGIPLVPLDQVVAVAFTSGSTGQPTPSVKSWRALTSVAQATGTRLGIKARDPVTVVATVPHQHMFGLEASVMLPLRHGLVMHAERPLFPEDIRHALADATGDRILVTTPLHIRACVAEQVRLPPLRFILSATAPLTRELAQVAERQFQTRVHEIFGFAEAGSIGHRRTVLDDHWHLLDGVRLERQDEQWTVFTDYLASPVPCPDHLSVEKPDRFLIHGRAADQVNIAGHRISLGDLNQTLLEIEGVQDGVFFLPDEAHEVVTRLMAFVVAPGKSEHQIQRALRSLVDPVFLPRPLVLVPRLPRNATGKLPRELLLQLAAESMVRSPHDV